MKTRKLLFGTILGLGLLSLITSCDKTEEDNPTLGAIALECDYFETNRTLTDDPNREVDYFIDCLMYAEADISIEPGVVIEFGSDAGIEVTQNGSLSAVGSASDPISFTGENKVKGSWKGVLFNSNNTKNKLHFVNINYAGGAEFNSNGDIASVIIWADTKLSIQSSSISNSASYGLSAVYTSSNWSISESSITFSEDAPIVMSPSYFNSLNGSNSYENNINNYVLVELYTAFITENTTMKSLNLPYQFTQTSALHDVFRVDEGNLTIEAGAVLQFEDGVGMLIAEDASLTAEGSSTNPILFTGVTKSRGAWGGLYFEFTTSPNNQIKNATIEYAGNDMWNSDNVFAGIMMWDSPYLNIEDVTIQYTNGCSLHHRPLSIANSNLTTSNLIHNDTDGTICQD